MESKQDNLNKLSLLIKQKNEVDNDIAHITNRPAERGHTGEYIASCIFDIELQLSATHKGSDGYFKSGTLAGKSVNVKWYGKQESILDINQHGLADYHLVMTGPKSPAVNSRGTTRPWVVTSCYLVDIKVLITQLKSKIGIATSVPVRFWHDAEIYPEQRNNRLLISEEQKRLLQLFN